MLAFMLSLPANWTFRLLHLSGRREGHGNGRHAVRAALGEMEAAGYLEIKRTRGSDGRINGVEWHIADRPIFTRTAPCSDFPTVENPTSESLTLRKKESTREKNEAAARPAQPATQHAAAALVSTSAPTPRRRRGDQKILHGVVVWTDQDEAGVLVLVKKHGVQEVEEVAARLTPPLGTLAPYLSAIVAAFQEREARAARDAAVFTAAAATAAAPPRLDVEAVRTKMARARAAASGEVAL